MNYSDLGKYVEELMKSYIKGEIDEKELVKFIDTRIKQMKNWLKQHRIIHLSHELKGGLFFWLNDSSAIINTPNAIMRDILS